MTRSEIIHRILENFHHNWLTSEDDFLMLAMTGSRGYGTHLPTSDYDVVGIVKPTIDMILGTDTWESAANVSKDLDYKLYTPRKYLSILAKGSVNNVETLFLDTMIRHPSMDILWGRRHSFLTTSTLNSIFGYTESTLRRYKDASASDHGSKRRAMIEAVGYDCSAAAHCLRWLWMGLDLAQDSTVLATKMHTGRALMLQAVKHGDVGVDEVDRYIHRYRTQLREQEEAIRPTLTAKINMRITANSCLVHIHKDILRGYA